MADAEEYDLDQPISRASLPRRTGRWVLLAILVIVAGLATYGWLTREKIAGNIIEQQLADYDIPGTYKIVRIGPERQILRNVVLGDPEKPDLTIEQVEIYLRYRLGTPTIGRVKLVKPRLFGSLHDGKLSFGSLDSVIFAETEEPPALPDMALDLVDGRALVTSDFGPIAIKAEGHGLLDDGFQGLLAATAPGIAGGGCTAATATLFGKVTTSAGKPKFDGPLRIRDLACKSGDARLVRADMQISLEGGADLAGVSGTTNLKASRLASYGAKIGELGGKMQLQWRDGQLTLRYAMGSKGVEIPQLAMNGLSAEGILRMRPVEQRSELDADITGTGITRTGNLDRTLEGISASAQGTLGEPLLAKLRAGLRSELKGASLKARVIARQNKSNQSLVIPNGNLRGASGANLLALSQVQLSDGEAEGTKLTGNFSTGGANLPVLQGRMDGKGGTTSFKLRMTEYRAGSSKLAIPSLTISQKDRGRVSFAGQMLASGAIPGGNVESLQMPIDGNWSERGGLTLWTGCQNVGFASLTLQNLRLARKKVLVCPSQRGAIARSGSSGLEYAAEIQSLDLSGSLGESPIKLASGEIEIDSARGLSAREVDIALGQGEGVNRFKLASVDASFAGSVGGTFDGAEVYLAATPLDIVEGQGQWNFADSVLNLGEGQFRLLDRAEADRFNPLVARDAVLTLQDNVITAHATMRNPRRGVAVTDVDISHDLSSGTGHADLAVPGLHFSKAMQPDDLTDLVRGVIALVDGIVTGQGRIDWNPETVTSSGEFSSEGLDLAAAFGPVYGLHGTVHFTDLLALTTAPDQVLDIKGLNPGVFVADGRIRYEIRDGHLISVKGGVWPFMGGTLTLRPVNLDLTAYETRRYVIEIVGADAAQFLATMNMGNLAASGIFDGTVPLVFDGDGNGWIEEGLLISRQPGGNLSYIGDLTYEDMSPMANFAFDMLRSIDFRQMMIELEGPLVGEIVTRVQFDGVRQGKGASQNFVTRQIARLPIKFKVNIRAPFYQLIGGLRSLYDANYLRDPRELGLLTVKEGRFSPSDLAQEAEQAASTGPENMNSDESSIQPEESEKRP